MCVCVCVCVCVYDLCVCVCVMCARMIIIKFTLTPYNTLLLLLSRCVVRVLWGQRQRLTRDDADQVLHSMLALTRGAGEYEGKRLCDGLVAQLAAWKAEHPDLQVRVRRGRVINGLE